MDNPSGGCKNVCPPTKPAASSLAVSKAEDDARSFGNKSRQSEFSRSNSGGGNQTVVLDSLGGSDREEIRTDIRRPTPTSDARKISDYRGTEQPPMGSSYTHADRPSAPSPVSTLPHSTYIQPSQQRQSRAESHHQLAASYPSVRSCGQQIACSSSSRSGTTMMQHQSSSPQTPQLYREQSIAAGGDHSSLHYARSAVDVPVRRPQPLPHHPPSFGQRQMKSDSSELTSPRMQVVHDIGSASQGHVPSLLAQQQYACPPLPSGQPPHRIIVHQQQPEASTSRSSTAHPHPHHYVGSQRFYAKSLEAAIEAQMGDANVNVNALFTVASPKQKYRGLKRKLKLLVYENECYQEELRTLQRKLLKLSRDKNFLLDRLQGYEGQGPPSSDDDPDSDASEKTLEDRAPAKGRKRGPKPQRNRGRSQNPGGSDATTNNGVQHTPLAHNAHIPAAAQSGASTDQSSVPMRNGESES